MRLMNLVISVFLVAACASRTLINKDTAEIKNQDILSISSPWIKDKGKKYDIQLTLENKSDSKYIIVRLSDIQCFRGNQRGHLTHTFFNTGERVIDFFPSEVKTFNAVCRFGTDQEGIKNVRILVSKVYENPSEDGVQTGSVLSTDVLWSYEI